MADETPSYYRLRRKTVEGLNDMLTPMQAAKVLYALEMLFFYGTGLDDLGLSLNKQARGAYVYYEDTVLNYRKNVLNGSKNTGEKTARKSVQETFIDSDEDSIDF